MRVRILLLLGALGLVSAAPETLTLSVRSVKPVYPNEKGQSTLVTIRIYLLKDDARFEKASVNDLWVKDREMLGADRLAMKEQTLIPGEADDHPRQIELGEAPAELRFVAILALINKEDPGPRKLVLAKKDLATVIRVTGNHLEREK